MPDRSQPREAFELRINGEPLLVEANTTVAAAICRAGVPAFRRSVSGEARAPFCGMGVCAECRATVNGIPDRYTCQVLCRPDMTVETEAL